MQLRIDSSSAMKSLTTAASLILFSSVSTFAADLPSIKSAPFAAPTPIWTGFYAGLNIGYGFGTSNGSYTKGGPLLDTWDDDQRFSRIASFTDSSVGLLFGNTGSVNMTQSGVIGGGQIGYNYQWNERYIFGAEADIQGSGIAGNGVLSNIGQGELDYTTIYGGTGKYYQRYVLGKNYISANVNWFGTARGRIGYLITPTLMGYATGGLTYGEITAASSPTALASYYSAANFRGVLNFQGYQSAVGINGNTNQMAVGWNAGGGFEWMFLKDWSVKTEAFYYNLGSQTVTSFTYASNAQLSSTVPTGKWMTQNYNQISYNGIVARAGVNYHFNFASAPVVAKF